MDPLPTPQVFVLTFIESFSNLSRMQPYHEGAGKTLTKQKVQNQVRKQKSGRTREEQADSVSKTVNRYIHTSSRFKGR